jgi:ribosome-associated protein
MTKVTDLPRTITKNVPTPTLDEMSTETSAGALAKMVALLVSDRKGSDILILDLSERSSITDYFVLCTGRSDVQVQAICHRVAEGLSEDGVRPLSSEGLENGQWALLDYGDVVVHVFQEATRELYDLEKLWIEAPRWTYNAGSAISVEPG